MPDTNKTITAPEATNAASAAPVKPVAAGENKALNAAPTRPASVSKPAVAAAKPPVADKTAASSVQSKDAPKTPTASLAKPAAAVQGRTSAAASVAKPATGNKPEESSTKPAGTTATPVQLDAKTAALAKSATGQWGPLQLRLQFSPRPRQRRSLQPHLQQSLQRPRKARILHSQRTSRQRPQQSLLGPRSLLRTSHSPRLMQGLLQSLLVRTSGTFPLPVQEMTLRKRRMGSLPPVEEASLSYPI